MHRSLKPIANVTEEIKTPNLIPLKKITCEEKVSDAFALKSGRLLTYHSNCLYRIWDTRHEIRLVFEYKDTSNFIFNFSLLLSDSILLSTVKDEVLFNKEGFDELIRIKHSNLYIYRNFTAFAQLSYDELIWCDSPDQYNILDEIRNIYQAKRQPDFTFQTTVTPYPKKYMANHCLALSHHQYVLGSADTLEFWTRRSAKDTFELTHCQSIASTIASFIPDPFSCYFLEKINDSQLISVFTNIDKDKTIIVTYDFKKNLLVEKLEFSGKIVGELLRAYYIPSERMILKILQEDVMDDNCFIHVIAHHLLIFDLESKALYQFTLKSNERFLELLGNKLVTVDNNQLKISTLPHLASYDHEIKTISHAIETHSDLKVPDCSQLIAQYAVAKNPAAFYHRSFIPIDEKTPSVEFKTPVAP